jgi:hypothetical protein
VAVEDDLALSFHNDTQPLLLVPIIIIIIIIITIIITITLIIIIIIIILHVHPAGRRLAYPSRCWSRCCSGRRGSMMTPL